MPLDDESFDEVREWSGAHIFDTTVKYFHGALTSAEYRTCRRALATNPLITESGRVCFVMGYGSQPRSTYRLVSRHNDVDLIWTGPCIPLFLWPFSLLAAGQSGLLRIRGPKAVSVALHLLSYMGMVELLWCSSTFADDVIRYVRRMRWRAEPGTVVGKDPTYFLFGVERENPTYETRIAGWSSFGPRCPSDLQAVPLAVAG